MFFSKPQIAVLELLRICGALSVRQTEELLRRFHKKLRFAETVRPLCDSGLAYIGGEYLIDRCGGSPNLAFIKSVDAMLLSEPEGVPQFQKGTDPFTLTFFKQRKDKLWRYDICPVRPGTEVRINAALENIPAKYRKILFLPDSMEQQTEIHVACEHCFVLHDKDGYHFYQ